MSDNKKTGSGKIKESWPHVQTKPPPPPPPPRERTGKENQPKQPPPKPDQK
jgi:hypothetical protein